MSEMVERVAEIIDPDAFDYGRDLMHGQERRKRARHRARAAIEAMLKPSDNQTDAGIQMLQLHEKLPRVWRGDQANDVYDAMIREALK